MRKPIDFEDWSAARISEAMTDPEVQARLQEGPGARRTKERTPSKNALLEAMRNQISSADCTDPLTAPIR